MSFSVKQAFVGRDKKRAPLKTPAWEAKVSAASLLLARIHARLTHCECVSRATRLKTHFARRFARNKMPVELRETKITA